MPVGAKHYKILDLFAIALLQTEDGVIERGLPFLGRFEADDERFAAPGARVRFLPREVKEWIRYLPLARGLGGHLFDGRVVALFLRSEVAIGPTFFEQFVGRRRVLLGVIGLEVWPLVVIEAQPLQTFEDSPNHLFTGALDVGVFDAEDEFAAGLAGEQPVEQRGARPADVQISGRRRGETNTNL